MTVLATAGHVDHGKSTLVLALTGTDPDRLREEKERGLTIDLGFAWTELPSGREVAFVDVPGHVRFLKNMLAGIGGVQGCLFVVAAVEGWKPQTEEHLRILEILGVGHGLVVLTKVAGLDADALELARLDVADHVGGTFLEDSPVVAVDAPAAMGLDDLRTALDALVDRAPAAADRGRPRLWVDRSFAARGSGTVITGTLTGGPLAVGDEVEVGAGRGARVRALQSHKRTVDRVGAGQRVAVNLAGIGHVDVARGDALVRPAQWERTATVDASLRVLGSLGHAVSRRGAFHAYVGSGEHPVRLRVLGAAAIPPGGEAAVRLHLPVALPLLPGDRYVLRDRGRDETVGGGEILDVAPVLPAAKARPDRSVGRVVAERRWVDAGLLERLTGERRTPDVGHWVVDREALAQAQDDVRREVAGAGDRGLDLAALDERARAVLAALDDVVVTGGRARPRGAGTDSGAGHPFLEALDASPFAPPPPDAEGVDRGVLADLVRSGRVVERDGAYFSARAIDDAAAVVATLLDATPHGVTVAEVRDALGTSRKHVLPLLAHLDATGVTRRRGDLRVAGPRLPAPRPASTPPGS